MNRLRYIALFTLAVGLAVAADSKPAPAPAPPVAADKLMDPFSSQKLSTLGAQMQALQAQAENLQLKQQLVQIQAKEIVADAFKTAGLSQDEWDLDIQSGKFTKKSPPPAPAPPAKK